MFSNIKESITLCNKRIKAIVLIVAIILLCNIPVFESFASANTTIIALDPNRNYEKGEMVTVTVGISSTDGQYLKSAGCGFGYNGSTMKLITQTEGPDHFYVESENPVKWLYYDLKFEMITDGKMYFIAGAYSGDGVIKAIKANGSRIDLPRASVVYKIGTGQYTKVSDCNLKDIVIKDNNEIVSLNRPFDKNITEYWVSGNDFENISFEGKVENSEDKIIYPNSNLTTGDNIKEVIVQAKDGVKKLYKFHIEKPEHSVSVTSLSAKDDSGKELILSFDEKIEEYYLEVENDINNVIFSGKPGNEYVDFTYPDTKVDSGYNNKKVIAKTDTDSKIYNFNIFKKPSPLTITSFIGELSDETTLQLDQVFSPDITEYSANCTADVERVKLIYTLGNESDIIIGDTEYQLDSGINQCALTVSDGINEKTYTISVLKDEYKQAITEDPEPTTTINDKEITTHEFKDLSFLSIIFIMIILGFVIFITIQLKKRMTEYKTSEEADAINSERERKKRLKQKEKERKCKKKDS